MGLVAMECDGARNHLIGFPVGQRGAAGSDTTDYSTWVHNAERPRVTSVAVAHSLVTALGVALVVGCSASAALAVVLAHIVSLPDW